MMNRDLYKEAVNDIRADEKLVKELAVKMEKNLKKPRRSTGKFSIIAASVAVLLIAAVFVQNRFGLIPGNKLAQMNPGESITLSGGKGNIYVNKSEGIVSGKLFIPEGAYSKDYNMDELAELFGRNPIPVIPEGFKQEGISTNITFGPDGKMLFMSPLQYSRDINDPNAPIIDIRLNKDALPPKDCIYSTEPKESIIGGTKVIIGVSKMEGGINEQSSPSEVYEVYSAEFIHKGIGYNITAKRTDAQTFLDLLEDIIFETSK